MAALLKGLSGSQLPTHWLFDGNKTALSAVGAIASACPEMILICKVAVAPVIMGIPQPAGLKSHNGEVRK